MQAMSGILAGKAAVITGGGRGIGRAVAMGFAREGAMVCVAARSADQVEAVAAEITGGGGRALAVCCDVGDGDSVAGMMESAVNAHGQLDILVNCAGARGELGPVAESDPAQWTEGIRVNLIGPYLTCRAALPHLKAAGGGKIINVGSGVGHSARPGNSSYAAGKGGLCIFTRSLAMEVWRDGIAVYTELTRDLFTPGEAPPPQLASERIKQPEECVPVFLWLASHPPGGPIAQTFSLARRPL
jgi:3-oxoacyl-[acyl-carrier protein] reductase